MSCTKISRHQQLNAWKMEITTCTGNFFIKTTFLKWIPASEICKNQEIDIKKSKPLTLQLLKCFDETGLFIA